ncbi:MAG TPA: O-antigen ligase family protein [Acidobacteriaceae bacterium]|jgi:O-antigen ligase
MQQHAPSSDFLRRHAYVVMFFVCTLSVTTLLKIGEIQYLELILAFDLPVLVWAFARNGFQFKLFRPFYSISRSYMIFLAMAFALAFVALRQDFTVANETMLKRPLLVTISRMAELVLDVLYMLYLASCCREDQRLCRFGAKVYFWTAVVGGLYSILGLPLSYALQLDLGAYGDSHRMRGFDNEGGPYGTYLVSVLVVTYAIYRRGWLSRRQYLCGMTLFFLCLLGSQSKAGFFVLALMVLLYLVLNLRGWKRVSLIATMVALFVTAAVFLDLPSQIEVYREASAKYQQVSNLKSDDPNFVMGRVAGAVLAPRMIAAHPLAGIGWGNYPLVRDDPEYRQGSSFSLMSMDAPGLGLIDYIADLGFPLAIYLVWVLTKPAYLLRRIGTEPRVIAMAAVHPVAMMLGTHLNLIYPWAVVALALGMGFKMGNERTSLALIEG